MSNLFREIHKNSWLKRINTDLKKLPVTKKAEKFWVVFCVHDDFEALLEGYQEPRFAPLHQPDWTLSLQTTLHISHALVPTDSDYEFVITLSSTVARFTAPSWEAMQEWVSTIRSKLREMKIISPKENLYSRLPEIRQPLLPTRDPMSPLPAPPPVPAAIVPGIEPAVSHNGTTPTVISTAAQVSQEPTTESEVILSTSSPSSSTTPSTAPAPAQRTSVCTAMSNTLTQNLLNMLSDPIANLTHRLQRESLLDRPSTSTDTARSTADSDASTSSSASSSLARTFTANVLNNEKAPPPSHRKGIQRGESTGSSSSSDSFKSLGESITPLVIPRPQTSKQNVDHVGGDESNSEMPSAMTTSGDTNDSVNGNQGPTNITIIQVSDPIAEGSIAGGQSEHLQDNKTFMANIEVNCEAESPPHHSQTQTVVRVTSPKQLPSAASSSSSSPYDEIRNLETGVTNISVGAILIQSPVAKNNNIPTAASHTQTPPATGNYEQVFIGDRNNNNSHQNNTPNSARPLPTPYSVFLLSRQQRSASHVELTTPQRNLVQVNNTAPVTTIVNGGSTARPPGNNNNNTSLIEATQEATPESNTPSTNSSRPRKKTNASENSPRNGVESSVVRLSASAISPSRNSRQRRGDQAVPVAARKRSSSTSGDQRSGGAAAPQLPNVINVGGRQRIVSPPRGAPAAPGENQNLAPRPSGRISLREQQVVQLRREIVHPGGVRLQLRRKDCVGSIALVDAFSSVWIAGWKQSEHPMLYNALHIGDRLVSVAGIAVTSAAEVNKIIRNCQSAYIELIVRRVPFGRVYAIRRELDGQCLGLIRDSNTATIVDIIPNGLAARHGLPVKAKTCDGLSLTFWVLTEINGRPLNMFCKDNEVHDRLNAVGRDISILVQPLDLMAKLKKQLKGMRGYKDFIVQ